MRKYLMMIFLAALTCSDAAEIGVVASSSENYDFSSESSESDSTLEGENSNVKYPSFTYQQDSFDDLTSREDPLLVAPNPPYYTGPWHVQREEVSIAGISPAYNTPRHGWPTNLPHLPNFGPPLPYPALNSHFLASEAAAPPSTLTSNEENVQRSDQH